MSQKIYTKTGDKGQTSLLGGTRLPKDHIRIEAYGNVDELNSFIGLLRDQDVTEVHRKVLLEIQDRLLTIGAQLAADPLKNKMKLPQLCQQDISLLESEIDKMDAQLPIMKNFVLPGGHSTVSFCHLARCVCRRAERGVIHLSHKENVSEIIYQYLNRLSDYLFMLSRHLTFTLKAEEIAWTPRSST